MIRFDQGINRFNYRVIGVAIYEYVARQAAYAVIVDQKRRIAAVKGTGKYFLPGGGSLPDETHEQTVAREIREELAREVRIVRRIGEAVQYFYAGGHNYRMEAMFFQAEFASEPSGAGEHELYWLASGEFDQGFFHQCHAWAAGQIADVST